MATLAQAIRLALHYGETHLGVTDVFGSWEVRLADVEAYGARCADRLVGNLADPRVVSLGGKMGEGGH